MVDGSRLGSAGSFRTTILFKFRHPGLAPFGYRSEYSSKLELNPNPGSSRIMSALDPGLGISLCLLRYLDLYPKGASPG